MSKKRLKDATVVFRVNGDLLADFDIVANLYGRNRATHFNEIMIREVKRVSREQPEAFK
jgi:hypothetical protein